jgi:lysine 2-monooxygenase
VTLTRRELVVGGAAAGAGVVLGGSAGWLAGRDSGRGSAAARHVDVAIVGAGMAGTYCAWRLSTAPATQRRSVALIDGSRRIGGRLWSVPVPPVTNQVAELGGMRIPLDHQLINELVRHLGLPTIPFHTASPDTLVRLRGVRVRRGQVRRAGQFPYDLPPELAAMSPDEIIAMVLDRVGLKGPARSGGLETGDWLAPLSYQGRPLWQLRAADLLDSVLGLSGSEFVQDWTAYQLANVSAATWVGAVAAVGGSQYRAISGGFQRLPLELAERAQGAKATIELGDELLSAAPDPEGVRLELRSDQGGVRQLIASAVVLALPASALRLVRDRSPVLASSAALGRGLNHILDSDAVKVYLAYDKPWWRQLGLRPGRSVSSGPLKQTFYLPPGRDGRSLILASYAFGDAAADYWGVNAGSGSNGSPVVEHRFAVELTAQLSELHGVDVPLPVDGRGHWWSQNSHGAVFLWREGVRPWQMVPSVRQPVAGLPLFTCGDSMSLNQGWAVGAAQTAELVLREHFGLTRPTWMSPQTPLGT